MNRLPTTNRIERGTNKMTTIYTDETEEEIEEKTDKVKTMFVSVTKMYRVEYKVDYTLETTEEEDEVEEEMETWAHDNLVDESIDGDQLINQMNTPTGITIESSEHCSGSDEIKIETQEDYS